MSKNVSRLLLDALSNCFCFSHGSIGAFNESHGFSAVRSWLRQLYAPLLDQEYRNIKEELANQSVVHDKCYLDKLAGLINNLVQREIVRPDYREEQLGASHQPRFLCWAYDANQPALENTGSGRTKKAALNA